VTYNGQPVGSSLIGTNQSIRTRKKARPTTVLHTRPSEQASDFSFTDKTALGLGDITRRRRARRTCPRTGMCCSRRSRPQGVHRQARGVDEDQIPAARSPRPRRVLTRI